MQILTSTNIGDKIFSKDDVDKGLIIPYSVKGLTIFIGETGSTVTDCYTIETIFSAKSSAGPESVFTGREYWKIAKDKTNGEDGTLLDTNFYPTIEALEKLEIYHITQLSRIKEFKIGSRDLPKP